MLIRCADAAEELGMEMVGNDSWRIHNFECAYPNRLERHGNYHGEIHRLFANSSWSVTMCFLYRNLREEIRVLGHDPEEVIMEKIAFNRLRGYKHDKLA